MKLLGIISIDFDVTDQLLIRFSAFLRYWRENETVHQLFIDFKRAHDSLIVEVLCNILLELSVPMKLVWLIKMCFHETYSKVHIGKHSSDSFPIQNGLECALSPMLFNIALEYAIEEVQENQVRLKLNGEPQLLAYADDMILPGYNIETINKNIKSLIDAFKEVGLQINLEKLNICWCLVTRIQVKMGTYN
jgi:hypothetical protein